MKFFVTPGLLIAIIVFISMQASNQQHEQPMQHKHLPRPESTPAKLTPHSSQELRDPNESTRSTSQPADQLQSEHHSSFDQNSFETSVNLETPSEQKKTSVSFSSTSHESNDAKNIQNKDSQNIPSKKEIIQDAALASAGLAATGSIGVASVGTFVGGLAATSIAATKGTEIVGDKLDDYQYGAEPQLEEVTDTSP